MTPIRTGARNPKTSADLREEARALARKESYELGHDPGTYWRTGRKVGRTIYAVVREWSTYKELPENQHPLIGVMDTPELAAEAVRAHNLDIDIRSSR